MKPVMKVVSSKNSPVWYARVAIAVLLLTTIFWSILSARIQLDNSDQLVNSFMLQNAATFQGAIFPDAHSFLLKLPLFWLVQLFGATPFWYIFATVFLVLVTVGGLAYLLSRIEKRPVFLGTTYLALALCLLLVPTQPALNSLLPINLAMMTTRNIEYIVFIVGLILIIKSTRMRSRSFIAACLVLTLLVASDKLFFSLSIGGALISLVIYMIFKKKQLIQVSLQWLLASVVSYLLATATLFLLNITNLIHTTSSVGAGPYGLIHSVKDIINGMFYAVMGIFTNFGANPVVDVNIITNVPGAFFSRLGSLSTIGFIATIAITIVIIISMYRLVRQSIRARKPHAAVKKVNTASQLSLMLVWSSVAMIGIFILSNHYYPVDARYLAIIFFAGFVGLTTHLRSIRFRRKKLVILGGVLLAIIIITIPTVFKTYQTTLASTAEVTQRNGTIAKIVQTHPTTTLLGDYWRVMPIKLQSPGVAVTPLQDCATPRNLLTSTAWQPDLKAHSFTYLLSLDTQLAQFPHCSLADITTAYGKPTSSAVVSGTVANPKELLLFYADGIRPLTSQRTSANPDTVVPLSLSSFPYRSCTTSTTMQFVAHEDDDILFMNPDLLRDVEQGDCIRSVYFTAGDAGADNIYWTGRQKGAEAAYDAMLGKIGQVWTERIVQLPGGQFITIANPRGDGKISLIFLHLPDGKLNGNGFPATNNESLAKLATDKIPTLHTVDKSSAYSSKQLTTALQDLMDTYMPARIRSQSSFIGTRFKDHSDHTAVGNFTAKAYTQHSATLAPEAVPSITYYLGYPVHELPENVSPADFATKASIFMAFGHHDSAVCQTEFDCENRSTYGLYLHRQYTYEN